MQELVRAFTVTSRTRAVDHSRPQHGGQRAAAAQQVRQPTVPAGVRVRLAHAFARRVRRLA